MNAIIKFLGLLSLLSLASCVRLECNGLESIKGLKGFTDISQYFPTKLELTESNNQIKVKETMKDVNPNGYIRDGISSITKEGQVRLDFGQSDQENFYLFNAGELNGVLSGKASALRAAFEDGFWWSNGYNTRSLFLIECTAIHA